MSSFSDFFDPLPYFRKKVDTSGGPDACWPWRGTVSPQGYGMILVWGKRTGAHRYALEMERGKPLGDLWALHRCDNPPCCNPRHLYAGTPADNTADMIRRGRRVQGYRPRR